MIRGYEAVRPAEAVAPGRLQWGAALGAGFIAGLVLLIIPRGSPWASLTFFSPAIMGRAVPAGMMLPLPFAWAVHLGLSLVYGIIVSASIAALHRYRAVLVGGMIGAVLYLLNWLIVSLLWPRWAVGNQVPVIFTHVVFGMIAAGAYRGLLRRKVTAG
ncbi:MAG TPA: hypothetical protein VG167_05215 [Verrucomicrobiae bacterium]|nr:hypothetical protein [Verrucomicrobiae bacterium]